MGDDNRVLTSNGLVHSMPRSHMEWVTICGLLVRNYLVNYREISCIPCLIGKIAETVRLAERKP